MLRGGEALCPGGPLARSFPDYEDRPTQRRMADAVATALADAHPLVVEAGTGTGKTLAYLLPAIESGLRVVVSTGTRALQEQIARFDLPLIAELRGGGFRAEVLKGVSNYVCKRRLAGLYLGSATELTQQPLELPTVLEPRADAGPDHDTLDALGQWLEVSRTGDRSEFHVAEDAPLWRDITTGPDGRLGSKCPHFEDCFVTAARRRAEQADLVVVNHHLFFADLALRTRTGGRVLPSYDAVIFDEAHTLFDAAISHFSRTLSTAALAGLMREFLRAAELELSRGGDVPLRTTRQLLEQLAERGQKLLTEVAGAVLGDATDAKVALPPSLFEGSKISQAWFALDTALEECAQLAAVTAASSEQEQPLLALADRADGLRDALADIAEHRPDDPQHVAWVERAGQRISLTLAPTEATDIVQDGVLSQTRAVVFASATLSCGGGFDYARQRLGLAGVDDAVTLPLATPFDFKSQALLYVPRDLPEPSQVGFGTRARRRIAELCELSGGNALVLFTSHRALQQATAQFRRRFDHPLLVQGEAPKAELIERMREGNGSVLLATGSFWQGVDIPGPALSMVIIDKLPFAPPDDPLVQAQLRHAEAAGRDGFDEVQLPSAALALKQGFGRLIRRSTDRGIVAVLDRRLVERGYGQYFFDTLPADVPRTSALERVRRFWHG